MDVGNSFRCDVGCGNCLLGSYRGGGKGDLVHEVLGMYFVSQAFAMMGALAWQVSCP